MEGASSDRFTAHWRLWIAIFWVAVAAIMIFDRWNAIRWFALGDTDDNLRMMQVRAWMEGQDWYDLRQYRLNPAGGGADIHWSRIVDLPIAGLKLLLSPLMGGPAAERWAVAIAPMLPMALGMAAVAVTARRMLSPKAFALAVGILICAHSTRSMWSPLRIDHHGWQLALLATATMALTDPRRARGGAMLGASSALSLAIGMEMLPYLALTGAAAVLMWVRDGGQARRLATYGATLAGGCGLGYLLFASYANSRAVCDALSPVWLFAMVAAGALSVGLACSPLKAWWLRLGAAGIGGAAIALAFVWQFPDCLGRPEQASPLLERLWLSKVREAMPVYEHPLRTWLVMVSLPIVGLIGYAVMLWRHRRDEALLMRWAALALLAFASAALLLWQTRAAPPAQLLAVPGATALGWLIIPWFQRKTNMLVRIVGTVSAFVLVSGLATLYATQVVPEAPHKGERAANNANGRCPTMSALRPVALQPPGTVLTFVDLGPRLITVTPHSAVAGPYHRNGQQITDVMLAWRGTPENARRTAARYRVDYLLICPGLSESTIYRAEAPRGFYMQLTRGQVPGWLEPIRLPAGSPYRMYRVRR